MPGSILPPRSTTPPSDSGLPVQQDSIKEGIRRVAASIASAVNTAFLALAELAHQVGLLFAKIKSPSAFRQEDEVSLLSDRTITHEPADRRVPMPTALEQPSLADADSESALSASKIAPPSEPLHPGDQYDRRTGLSIKKGDVSTSLPLMNGLLRYLVLDVAEINKGEDTDIATKVAEGAFTHFNSLIESLLDSDLRKIDGKITQSVEEAVNQKLLPQMEEGIASNPFLSVLGIREDVQNIAHHTLKAILNPLDYRSTLNTLLETLHQELVELKEGDVPNPETNAASRAQISQKLSTLVQSFDFLSSNDLVANLLQSLLKRGIDDNLTGKSEQHLAGIFTIVATVLQEEMIERKANEKVALPIVELSLPDAKKFLLTTLATYIPDTMHVVEQKERAAIQQEGKAAGTSQWQINLNLKTNALKWKSLHWLQERYFSPQRAAQIVGRIEALFSNPAKAERFTLNFTNKLLDILIANSKANAKPSAVATTQIEVPPSQERVVETEDVTVPELEVAPPTPEDTESKKSTFGALRNKAEALSDRFKERIETAQATVTAKGARAAEKVTEGAKHIQASMKATKDKVVDAGTELFEKPPNVNLGQRWHALWINNPLQKKSGDSKKH